MSTNLVCILITILLYFVVVLTVGFVFARKNKSVSHFYLGDRSLGPFVTAMSAEASDMSSYLLMGLPGLAYLCGLADVGWTAIGLALGTYLNWLIVAKRLRIYSHRCRNSITIPDFFANRFHDRGRALLCISALIILIFFVPYTASGFAACGKLFQSLFGIDYHAAMIASAVIIIAYTCTGGFLAASTSDLIQSLVMIVALIVIMVYGIHVAGGVDVVLDNASALSGYLSMTYTHTAEGQSEFGILAIASTLAWGLGYFGMPHIQLRFMAIGDEKKVRTSRRIATVWCVISMGVAIVIGLIGNALASGGSIEAMHTSADAETVIMRMAMLMSNDGVVAALFAGLIFAGIFACTMSTSDSQLLAASSAMSENIIGGVMKIRLSARASMLSARLILLVIAAISMTIAWDPDSSIFEIVSFAWAGFGATFGPLMLAALFWKRTNKYGALAGLIVGGVTVFLWKFVISTFGGGWAIYELLPAFTAALVAIVAVSLFTPKPGVDVAQEFEAVRREVKSGK